MKLNTLFLISFLILSIKTEINLNLYSIQAFIDHLKDTGLLEIIESIKMTYGQDVAIISCEELNKNYGGDCKRLVVEYIPETSSIPSKSKGLKCIEILNNSPILEKPYPNSDIKRKIQIKSIADQLKLMSVKVRKRVKELGLCKE